jgi:hypothetical protein
MKRNKTTTKAARRRKAPGPGLSRYSLKRARWAAAQTASRPVLASKGSQS